MLDENHDLKFVDNNLAFVENEYFVKQKIKQRLLMFKGEWFLDVTLGIPYYEDILVKDVKLSRIEAIYIREVQKIEQIEEITAFDISLDNNARKLSIYFEVKDRENNAIEVNL